MTKIKLAIVGSRSFTDYEFMKKKINDFLKKNELQVTHIVSGGAKGVDKMGERYADEYNLSKIIHKPDYEKYPGHVAPLIRNEYIARDCDVMIAFWDGKSGGTKNAREWQTKYEKDLITVYV